jgi:hypothetical protein
MVRCLKPSTVMLLLTTPDIEPLSIRPDCARELAKEIVDSVPGRRRDADRVIAARKERVAHV